MDLTEMAHAAKSGLANIHDSLRGDVIGHLCGQSEPHGHFVTRAHEYVIIDNECMFADSPSLRECHWVKQQDAQPLILEVCRGVASLSDEELATLSSLPAGYDLFNAPDAPSMLRLARIAALEYVDLFGRATAT